MEDKEVLYKGDWLDLVKIDEYECLDEPDIVLILVKRIFEDGTVRYAIRSEFCPPYSTEKNYYTMISGKIDEGEDAKQAAIRELEEEAGIKLLDKNKMQDAFDNIPICKSTTMRTYLMNCTIREVDLGITYEMVDIKGDGTENEAKSNTLWLTFEEMIEIIENNDTFDLLFYLATFIYREAEIEEV